ncbi:MAG: glycosidase [Phycisphaerales bacterium]|nr:glycosidase [Phycisphaerales bacterium]
MFHCPIQVARREEKFVPDARRVITRLFLPGSTERIKSIIQRVLAMDEDGAARWLERVIRNFATRHKHLSAVWQAHFDEVAHLIESDTPLSVERQHLIGAYLTSEYSFEAAALFNPSIVAHHDQSGLPDGALRFLMSLRATGEGHVSSIVFRTGIIAADGEMHFDPVSPFAHSLKPKRDTRYDKQTFFYKVIEVGAYTDQAGDVLDRLGDTFMLAELEEAIADVRNQPGDGEAFNATAERLLWVARSNYELELPPRTNVSEVVIFPSTENESRGIEDMRLVRFQDDDGTVVYYGTYTAYNGFTILPQLMEARDFCAIRIMTLNGKYAQNKGHALFPRRVGGWYMMSSRVDGENLYLMKSKNVRFWNDAEKVQVPVRPWEFVQIGNCGSPLETEHGWLLLTHGVGPMRQYCIGVSLLDLRDPLRVLGHLREPLLVPLESERDGYVPNVVYSCGAIIHQDRLIIPYAMSDSATSCATVDVNELLFHLRKS